MRPGVRSALEECVNPGTASSARSGESAAIATHMLRLAPVAELDQYVYQADDVFHWDSRRTLDVQWRLLREAFESSYERCAEYRAYCERVGVAPSSLRDPSDLDLIPLVPTVAFKENETLRSVSAKQVVKRCTSSGTEGSVSVVHRDEDTLNRFLGSVRKYLDQVLDVEDAIVLNLGPSTLEAKDLWFSYVMSITDMVFPLVNFVQGDVFRPADVVEAIAGYRDRYRTVVITGAPIMFLNLFAHMRERALQLDRGEQILAVTAGGWKKHEKESISRPELVRALCERFTGFKPAGLRDTFNMVELNSIISECEHGRKHVLPWVRVRARDPETFGVCRPGELGLLSFLDPTATSYPGFLLASDLGRVLPEERCPCGRTATSIEIVRRVQRTETRGCALKMAKQYGAHTA